MKFYENYVNESDIVRNFTYERLAKPTKGKDTEKLSNQWFERISKDNCLVKCSKLSARFHKRHCEFMKEVDTSKLNNSMYLKSLARSMKDCDEKVCFIAKAVKEA